MRVVVDVNVLVSALIVPTGPPAAVLAMWLEGRFTLLTCAAHIEELRSTLGKPKIAHLIKPHRAGRLVNEIRKVAEGVDPLPHVRRSSDPDDDHLLSMAERGNADFIVTGDRGGLLAESHGD